MASTSGEILIVTAFLETLSANARTATTMLDQCSDFVNLGFVPNDDVTQAFNDFNRRWKKTRQGLQEGLDAVAQAFADACQAFRETDSELAAAVLGQERPS